MKSRAGIVTIIMGVVVGLFGIYHGATQNTIDPGYVLGAVGLSLTVSSTLTIYLNKSIDKRIDDLRDNINKRFDDLRDDIKGINQRLQNHKHS